MTALAVNDDHAPTTIAGLTAVRAMGAMSDAELRRMIAHALAHLHARTGIYGVCESVRNIMRALPNDQPATMTAIITDVALKYGLRPHELTASDDQPGARHFDVAHARQESMWRCRRVRSPGGSHRWSTTQVGLAHGGRDHTTAVFGVRRHEARLRAEMD